MSPKGRFDPGRFNTKSSSSEPPRKKPSLRGRGGQDSRGWKGSSLPRGRREQKKPSSLGPGLSVLGLAQHSRLKLSEEGSHDLQIPVNLGLGDMVLLERR